ncbi:MAG: lytic transglycosylase domain-containing protein [Vampirovibrionales bacterium]|nr:lytic transglycosylase domain-containing protein [Vampirovibrionales bacterium]
MNSLGQLQSGQGIAAIESRVRQIESMIASFQAPKLQGSIGANQSAGNFLSTLGKTALSETATGAEITTGQDDIVIPNLPGQFEPMLDPGVPQLPPLENVSSLKELSSLNAMNGVLKTSSVKATRSESAEKSSLASLIDSLSGQYGVDNALINAIVKQESGFNPNAVSSSGAVGLMQLMPETANALGVINPSDPKENLDGGVRYLKQLLSQFNGNIPLALAAYNAGPTAVKKHDGIPPYAETQRYVKNILKTYLSSKESV